MLSILCKRYSICSSENLVRYVVIEQTVPWFTPVTVIKSPAVNTSAPPVNGAPMYIPRDKVEDEKREEDSRQ